MNNIFFLGLFRFVLEANVGVGNGMAFTDTLSYEGFIAVEMANTLVNSDRVVDLIDEQNMTSCLGFVLFKDNITERNFEQFFFPLGLCDEKMIEGEIINTNNVFYDRIFNNVKEKGKKYSKTIKVKGVGKVRLNYMILRANIKYVIMGQRMLNKYIRNKIKSEEQLQIKSSICKIFSIEVN